MKDVWKKGFSRLPVMILAVVSLFWTGCGKQSGAERETRYFEFNLAAPFDDQDQEYSGLAWHGNYLVLLPQYPGGALPYIHRDVLENYLSGEKKDPIEPHQVPLNDEGLADIIPGYEGFEALLFDSNDVYFTLESETSTTLSGYLIKGSFQSLETGIRLDYSSLVRFATPVALENMTFESLIMWDNHLIPIYEVNGTVVNPDARQPRFDKNLEPGGFIAFDGLEYRITDATTVDEKGTFWVINYFWEGDSDLINPGVDQFETAENQKGSNGNIERLVEYRISGDRILLTGSPPVWISDPDGRTGNNWEGLARFGEDGFLIVTDKHDRTILGFIKK